jgi:hypothetical protein
MVEMLHNMSVSTRPPTAARSGMTASRLIANCIAVLLASQLAQARALAGTVEFPNESNGPEAIKQLVEAGGAKAQTEYQSVVVEKGAFLFLVSHDRGQHMSTIYTYLYGCDGFLCQLVAMRHSGIERLTAALNKTRSELVLRSTNGKRVFLRMPLLLKE